MFAGHRRPPGTVIIPEPATTSLHHPGSRQEPLSIAVAVWAAVCGPVLAAAGDGNELLAACLRPAETFDRGYCLGYIVGAAGALELEASVCPPKGITLGQLKDVVVRYLQAATRK